MSTRSSFDVMPGIRTKMPRPSPRWLPIWRVAYRLRAVWRRLRVSKTMTGVLGPQYRRSRDLIEIDITYRCNLSCLNCNRSVARAPDHKSMEVATIRAFVDQSLARGKDWRRIRVLGGEPTLHPQFAEIIDELLRYRREHPTCIVEVVTNGHGGIVERKLAALPPEVWVEDSQKSGVVQPDFRPFSDAPIDSPHMQRAAFQNACAIARDCGMGLTPSGYYPCAVAGGIDRVLSGALGVADLPDDDDDMLKACAALCRYCGRFADGHFVPRALREPLTEEVVSPTWDRMYAAYAGRRATRNRRGTDGSTPEGGAGLAHAPPAHGNTRPSGDGDFREER